MKRLALVSTVFLCLIAPARVDSQEVMAAYHNAEVAYQAGHYETAFREYQKLAEQGFARDQFELATIYVDGLGVPRDYAQAARWYRRAAEQGEAEAQAKLGARPGRAFWRVHRAAERLKNATPEARIVVPPQPRNHK